MTRMVVVVSDPRPDDSALVNSRGISCTLRPAFPRLPVGPASKPPFEGTVRARHYNLVSIIVVGSFNHIYICACVCVCVCVCVY